jgi:predicted peroxiredoxin
MKFAYVATKGLGDATLASLPFHLAVNGSIEAGQEASIILAGDAAELIVGDNAQSVEGVGIPPLRDLLSKVREHEVPVYV